jgi:HdeA/HdeB family
MKNSSTVLSIIGASAFAVLSMTASAEAKKLGDWTCSDFLKASSSQKSMMVYFFQGIKLADKKEALDLAAQDFNVPVSKVVQHCRKNPPDNLWDAIVNHFYWRATQIP